MATFENPNDPVQPQIGVYGWYASKGGAAQTAIYIGAAGQKTSYLKKGTLFRGVSQLQRNTFTSNSPDYDALDVDFIVGTAIRFFESKGYACLWKHISNQPEDEIRFVKADLPVLQNTGNGRVKDEFRIKKNRKLYWQSRKSSNGVKEAEEAIFSALERVFIAK
jgi:hypothetical protein